MKTKCTNQKIGWCYTDAFRIEISSCPINKCWYLSGWIHWNFQGFSIYAKWF